jgi:hypothetical protein
MTNTIVVYHSSYGCETGCCGHRIEAPHLEPDIEIFKFDHPDDGNLREWAEELISDEFGPDHVADLDWEHCLVLDYGHDPNYRLG